MVTETSEGSSRENEYRRLIRHCVAYAAVIGLLLAVNVLSFSGYLWTFWPAFGWGIVLLVHYLYVRTIHIEDEWVDERVDDLRMNSYDFDHIYTIRGRFGDGELDRAPSQRDED